MRARGIERRPIFIDDVDRENFLRRAGRLVEAGALEIFAWALMENHVHLLVRTLGWPLQRSMRSLLAGYATWFNLRHDRAGHLFQNRYKSTLCEEERYFLALVRYIHRNPVGSILKDLTALDEYPYTGHSVLLGRSERKWQNTTGVLAHFAEEPSRARSLYARYIGSATADDGADLEGGGLVRSVGGWARVRELQRGRERFSSDERILGGSRFVEKVLTDIHEPVRPVMTGDEVIGLVCKVVGIEETAVIADGRPRSVSRARAGIAFLWTTVLGRSGRAMALRLGIQPSGLHAAARRGAMDAAYWKKVLASAGPKSE
jgi:REP element-mobilizing transposase RayT